MPTPRHIGVSEAPGGRSRWRNFGRPKRWWLDDRPRRLQDSRACELAKALFFLLRIPNAWSSHCFLVQGRSCHIMDIIFASVGDLKADYMAVLYISPRSFIMADGMALALQFFKFPGLTNPSTLLSLHWFFQTSLREQVMGWIVRCLKFEPAILDISMMVAATCLFAVSQIVRCQHHSLELEVEEFFRDDELPPKPYRFITVASLPSPWDKVAEILLWYIFLDDPRDVLRSFHFAFLSA